MQLWNKHTHAPVAAHVTECRAEGCLGSHAHTRSHYSSSFQQRNQWVDFPGGHCATGMIPLLSILIAFRWLHWGAGHLPHHPALMTGLDVLIDSIEVTSKGMLRQPRMALYELQRISAIKTSSYAHKSNFSRDILTVFVSLAWLKGPIPFHLLPLPLSPTPLFWVVMFRHGVSRFLLRSRDSAKF